MMNVAPKRRMGWLPYEYVLKGDVCITTQTQQFCHNLSGHAFPLPPLSFPRRRESRPPLSFPHPHLSFPRRRESRTPSVIPAVSWRESSTLSFPQFPGGNPGPPLSFPRRRESRGLTTPPLIVNLGTGRGYSVLEMLHAFEKASGKTIPYQITDRRPGDIASCYADPSLAQKIFGWKAARSLEDMCADAWRWQHQNQAGYP